MNHSYLLLWCCMAYLHTIIIQMEMTGLLVESGMQTHIMPPHHLLVMYNFILNGLHGAGHPCNVMSVSQ